MAVEAAITVAAWRNGPRARINRRWPLISGITAVALAVALGLLIAIREQNLPFGFDAEWMEEIVEHRSPFWAAPSLAMNFLGGGWFAIFVVPLIGSPCCWHSGATGPPCFLLLRYCSASAPCNC